jgi:membrane protease YdiL (CAAX protease family)
MQKNLTSFARFKAPVEQAELKPTLILLGAALLLTLHRYLGSIEFAARTFPAASRFEATVFMFAAALLLMGLVPIAIVIFIFREPLQDYGLKIGDWKFGLAATAILFPVIAGLMLYPSSQTAEMKAFYPFDQSAGESAALFLRLELARAVLFYTAWEFFFRGFMLFGLRRSVGDWLAVCIQTIPSCLWHIGMPTGEIISSIPGGILFGLLALRTGSILWPWLLHFLIGTGLDFFIVITS